MARAIDTDTDTHHRHCSPGGILHCANATTDGRTTERGRLCRESQREKERNQMAYPVSQLGYRILVDWQL